MKSFFKLLPKLRYEVGVLFFFSAFLAKAPDAGTWSFSTNCTKGNMQEFLTLQMHRENVHLDPECVHSTDHAVSNNILPFALQFTVQVIQFCCDVH